MQFSQCAVDEIKSTSQKTLALHWSRCAGQNSYPLASQFSLPERGHDPNYLVVWEAVENGDTVEFRSAFQGEHIKRAFRDAWYGRSMAELIPQPLKPAALAAAEYCVRNGRGVYVIYRTEDANGLAIDCERTLLPVGDGQRATGMVASMELYSREGGASLSDAVSRFATRFEIVFSGWFEPKR